MKSSNNKTVAMMLAISLVLSACTTINPYTREEERSNLATGAMLGALAGAVVGAATGDDAAERKKRALIGAGAGALTGGSIGYYMDVQEAKLRSQLEGTGVSVTRDGDNIILNMPGNITFMTDSAELNTSFHSVLNSVGQVLKEYEKTVIVIGGHTDSTGSDSYNQQLSERRAVSVGQQLTNEGVKSNRMVIIGFGEIRPITSNGTDEGRQANRRVELTLEPLTE